MKGTKSHGKSQGVAHFQKMSLNWERAFCAYLVSKCSGSMPGGGMLSSSISFSFCLQQHSRCNFRQIVALFLSVKIHA